MVKRQVSLGVLPWILQNFEIRHGTILFMYKIFQLKCELTVGIIFIFFISHILFYILPFIFSLFFFEFNLCVQTFAFIIIRKCYWYYQYFFPWKIFSVGFSVHDCHSHVNIQKQPPEVYHKRTVLKKKTLQY